MSRSSPHGKIYRPQKAPKLAPTPRTIMQTLRAQHFTRFSMTLILVTCICLALLTTKGLLNLGVTEMWVRYLVALVVAYGSFFIGVWIWLHLSPYGRHLRSQGRRSDLADSFSGDIPLPSGSSQGGSAASDFQGAGGNFDGGGAGGNWSVSDGSTSVDTSGSIGNSLGDLGGAVDIGGDEGGCALVIAGVLLAALLFLIFGATFYVIYQAPAILAEVVFEVLLGSPLARGARAMGSANWPAVLFAKTWKPFAIVAAFAIGFALYCNAQFPEVASVGELLLYFGR
jgi:hypothetical protein